MKAGDIDIYSIGIVHCSVCAPKSMAPEAVTMEVNVTHPHSWAISEEPFRTGETNPCPCNDDPKRLHYLMVC